jgi:plastocyanin domain-containing protein
MRTLRLPSAVSLLALLALAAPPARAAEPSRAGRTVELKVTEDGFVPDKIEVKKGEPLTLVVTRQTDKTCATEIVIKDYGIDQPLPLGKAVKVSFTPTKTGQVKYACGMDMVTGVLVVQ